MADKASCRARVHDEGRGVGFHGCSNAATTAAGYCGTHDPDKQKARKAYAPKCAYVDEVTGEPDCSTTVRGTKYCAWHEDSVARRRIHAQARSQQHTLAWLETKRGCSVVAIDDVISRLTVVLKNT
jgi:hypothetical protein